MKKIIKVLLLALVTTFAFNAKAAVIEMGKAFTKSGNSRYNSYGLHYTGLAAGGSADAYIVKYNYIADGKSFLAYCVDPDKEPGNSGYTVKRILGEDTNSEKLLKHDAGIIAILANGCTQENNCSDNESYAATSIALRAYTLGLYGFIKTFDPYSGNISGGLYSCAIANTAAEWAAKNTKIANSVTGKNCSDGDANCFKQSVCSSNPSWKVARFETVSDTARSILENAERLFNIGLEASASEKEEEKNTNGTISLKFGNDTDLGIINATRKKTTDTNKDETKSIVEVPLVLEAKNIDKNTTTINRLKVDCPDCSSVGYTYKITYTDSTGTTITVTEATELAKYIPIVDKYRTGTIKLLITFTRDNSKECNGEIKYNVSYKTTAKTSTSSKGYIAAKLEISEDKNQRFYVIEKTQQTSDDKTSEKTQTINGTLPCDEINVCKTEIDAPDCYGDTKGYIKAPEDIKSCIIDNKDEAGNTYKSTLLSTNKYCSVYCKEDYATIQLQGVIGGKITGEGDVSCGGKFTLENNRIKGTKQCFAASVNNASASGNSKYKIDSELFEKDMNDLADKFLEEYRKYIEAVEGLLLVEYDSCKGATCSGDCSASGTKQKTYNYSYYGRNGRTITNLTGTNTIGEPPSCSSPTSCPIKWDKNGVATDWDCCGGGCSNGGKSTSELTSELETQRDNAVAKMEKLKEDYIKTIAEYNQCTTGWKSNDDILQKEKIVLKYKYNEHTGDGDFYDPYYSLLEENNIEARLEEIYSKTSYTVEVWKKTTTTDYANDKYSNKPFFTSNNADEGILDQYGYNSKYGNVFEKEGFIICSTSGCVVDRQYVSMASHVRKTTSSEKEYGISTEFGQVGTYGKIVTDLSRIAAEFNAIADEFNSIANSTGIDVIEKSLPISNKACVGGEFDIYISGLGQFYDTTDLKVGRLINYGASSGDANKSVSTYQKNNGIDTFDGNYICSYNTDCDCETEIEECDKSYAGEYYNVDDVCNCLSNVVGTISKIRIKCCVIKYKSEAVVETHPDEYLNKFYCSHTDEYYQTKAEAQAACTEYREINYYYTCADGKRQADGTCHVEVANTTIYSKECVIEDYFQREPCYMGYGDDCYTVSGKCSSLLGGIYRNGYCYYLYDQVYGYYSGQTNIVSRSPQASCPANYSVDYTYPTKNIDTCNSIIYGTLCTEDATCENSQVITCTGRGEVGYSCDPGFTKVRDKCVKNYDVIEIKASSQQKYTGQSREVVGVCYDHYGNKYDKSKLIENPPECGADCDTSLGGTYYDGECNAIDIFCCTNTGKNDVCKTADGECYSREGLTKNKDHCTPTTEDGCPNCKLVCNPTCEVVRRCVGENCCPTCRFKCFNCIFNNGKFNLTTKPISSTGLSNSMKTREYGYNWVTTTKLGTLHLPTEINEKMSLFSEKAEAAVKEITDNGETIYGGEKPSDSNALEFSIIMDQDVIKYLKEYNKEADKNGGYANESLVCYDDYDTNGKVKYKKVYCYSEVIDGLVANGARITIGNGERLDSNQRQQNSRQSGYWELWEQSEYYNGTKTNVLGGPAWK